MFTHKEYYLLEKFVIKDIILQFRIRIQPQFKKNPLPPPAVSHVMLLRVAFIVEQIRS